MSKKINTTSKILALSLLGIGINQGVNATGEVIINGGYSSYDPKPNASIGANQHNSIAIGNNSKIDARVGLINHPSVAIGSSTHINGVGSIALGNKAETIGLNNIAIGNGATVREQGKDSATSMNVNRSVSLGFSAHTRLSSSIAIGEGAVVDKAEVNGLSATGAVSIGKNTRTKVDGAVALGAGAIADRTAGVVGYIPDTSSSVTNREELLEKFNLTKSVEKIDELNTKIQEINTKHGNSYSDEHMAEVNPLKEEVESLNKQINNTSSAWISTLAAVSLGKEGSETRQITGVAAGSNDSDAVNVAQLKALTVKLAGDNNSEADVKLSGLTVKGAEGEIVTLADENGLKISLADSVKEKLNSIETNMSSGNDKLNTRINNVESNFNEKIDKANAGVAGATAIASMPALNYGEKFAISAGYGHYSGQNAVAVGVQGRTNSTSISYKVAGGISGRGNVNFGAGVSYALGNDTQMENKAKDKKIKELEAKVERLEKLIEDLLKIK